MFVPGERFSLDCEKGLYLFSSGKEDLMPGGVSIILVRVDSYCMTDAEVKQQRMRDRVFNIWDIERKKEAKKMQASLSLKPLYARPPPMWMCPSFSGLLADAFVQGSVLEGGVLGSAFAVTLLALKAMLTDASDSEKVFFKNFDNTKRGSLSNVVLTFKRSEDVFRYFRRLRKNPNHTQILSFLRKLRRKLHSVNVGESLILPATIENAEILLVLQRTQNNVTI